MEIQVDRKWKKQKYTISNMTIDGEFAANVLEDTDRGLRKEYGAGVVKKTKALHPKETAIPSGRYLVTFTYSPKFCDKKYAIKGMIPLINGVPGFSAIRMHAGRNAGWSEGCLLVGRNTVVGGLGADTEEVCAKVFQRMYLAWDKKEEIWVDIL